MKTPAELAARHTALDTAEFDHLQRLLVSWGVLADLSFSDLLLLAPAERAGAEHLVVLGQARPTTGATLLRLDLVGEMEQGADWPWAVQALASGQIVTGVAAVPVPPRLSQAPLSTEAPDSGEVPVVPELARLECVPVRYAGEPIAVVVRVGPLEDRRRPGRLERVYRDVYAHLAAMMVAGEYPFA
ncbi:MAG: histidine kinase N-terminal domain-containing protein, partial [Acidimicrobiales bacterium]